MLQPSPSRSPHRLPGSLALLIGVLLLPVSSRLAAEEPRPLDMKAQGKSAEDRGDWLQACRCYDEALRKNRGDDDARKGYLRCLRRLQLAARHTDPIYRQTLARLDQSAALATYEQVLGVLTYAYPERGRAELPQLFQQGLDEARLALEDQTFRTRYLPGARTEAVAAFKTSLLGWRVRKMSKLADAREQLWSVLRQASRDGLPMRSAFASALVMEFAAGACNGLDEYSSFLTPRHLASLQGTARTRPGQVGVGLEVAFSDGKLLVTRVYPKGPAQDAGLVPGDHILSIDGQPVSRFKGVSAAAAEKLLGKPRSLLNIEIQDTDGPKVVSMKRRAVVLPSVEEPRKLEGAHLGYLRINYFTENTLHEVKTALAELTSPMMGEPIKGLVLDLRGNPGGVFTAAVAVAELFLSGGVVVIGQSPFPEYNRTFKSELTGPYQLPIVVLVDGDTASSAEVLAAALKESRPATTIKVIGQPTYGKGSIQCLIQLKKAPLDKMAGIRLTVARLFSPSSQPLTGKGIRPDVDVKPEDDILRVAVTELKLLLATDGMTVAKAPPPAPA